MAHYIFVTKFHYFFTDDRKRGTFVVASGGNQFCTCFIILFLVWQWDILGFTSTETVFSLQIFLCFLWADAFLFAAVSVLAFMLFLSKIVVPVFRVERWFFLFYTACLNKAHKENLKAKKKKKPKVRLFLFETVTAG